MKLFISLSDLMMSYSQSSRMRTLLQTKFTDRVLLNTADQIKTSSHNKSNDFLGQLSDIPNFQFEKLPMDIAQFDDQCHATVDCKMCGKQFPDIKSVADHMKKFHGCYECLACNRTFNTNGAYSTHKKEVHERGCKWICSVCSKCFSRQSRLKLHEQTHSNMRCFICHLCNRSYKHKNNLKAHMLSAHSGQQINNSM